MRYKFDKIGHLISSDALLVDFVHNSIYIHPSKWKLHDPEGNH